jgi:5-methylcytosine-specific restriction endonuclease McrA
MGEAYDTYCRLIDGEIERMPFGFWKPPEGIPRLIEIMRKICEDNNMHPSEIRKSDMIRWRLESPLVGLYGGNVSTPRKLAASGIPRPEASVQRDEKKHARKALTNAVMEEVWLRDGGKCIECGAMEDIEFDHMIPFSKGGTSTPENLRILCRTCNRSRGNRI